MPDGRTLTSRMDVIDYPHIPTQIVFQPASATVVRADIKTLAHRVGYIAGAGDDVPQALRQMGCEVVMLDGGFLARGDLERFDAIVAGVRAYNVRPDLRANQPRLLEYVKQGGTFIVQYNTLGFGDSAKEDAASAAQIGPYPFEISHDRVTERKPRSFPECRSRTAAISESDHGKGFRRLGSGTRIVFRDRVGPALPIAVRIARCRPNSRGPGGCCIRPLRQGCTTSLLAYSWFRELPAGVPGAYRIFANLLSAGKTLRDDRSTMSRRRFSEPGSASTPWC